MYMAEDLLKVLESINSKMDAMSDRIKNLEVSSKQDAKPKTTAEDVLRTILKDKIPDAKLDAMELNDMLIAYDVVQTYKPLPAPPKRKTDSEETGKEDADEDEPFKTAEGWDDPGVFAD